MTKLTGHTIDQRSIELKMGQDYRYYNCSPANRVQARALPQEQRMGTNLTLAFARLREELRHE